MTEAASLLTLVVGAAFLALSNGRFAVPIAAWVAPVFLLRFTRAAPVWRGAALIYGVTLGAFVIAWPGMIPLPPGPFLGLAAGLCLLYVLPYLADRLAYWRLPRAAATLVLPTGMVAVNYLVALASPYGTNGDIAYSQADHLPLLQALSVVGVHGVTFLIFWVASATADVWERGFSWLVARYPVAVLLAVLLLGGLRLNASEVPSSTVRFAAVVVDYGPLFDEIGRFGFDLTDRAATPPEVGTVLAAHHEALLSLTEREASAGARLVAWSEAGAVVRKPEEPALFARVAEIAERHGVYVVMGLATYTPGNPLAENKLVTVGPDGQVVAEYVKAKIVPGDANVRGDGEVVVLDTPFGRVAHFICFDLDFPGYARAASRAGADILVAPSNDWREIDPYHSTMASYRAIENGAALIRPTRNGRSLAVDAYGRTLAEADHFASSPHVMVAEVPTAGVWTVYGFGGDAFAWVCTVAFFALVVVGWRRARVDALVLQL